MREIARFPTTIFSTKALRRVFNNREPVFVCDFKKRIEIDRMAENVYRHDRTHAPSSGLVDELAAGPFALRFEEIDRACDIHLPVNGLSINQHGPRIRISNRIRGRDEGQIRDEHFIIGLHTRNEERNVQRGGPRRSGDTMSRANIRGYIPLQLLDERTNRRHPTRVETFFDVAPLIAAQLGHAQRNAARGHRCARLK